MKLSEAILKGCEMTPKQAFINYGAPGQSTCVLGAAMEGIGKLPDAEGAWPLPGGVFQRIRERPLSGLPFEAAMSLRAQMTALNDDLMWSREKIAAALAERGL